MKCQILFFSVENKKKKMSAISAELAQRVVKFNQF